MKAIRSKIAKYTVALFLASGLIFTGGSVATAQPAEAATYGSYTNCKWDFTGKLVCRRWVNYNWWEELWGKRDGWEYDVLRVR